MVQLTFDPNQHEPEADFTVVPKGEYNLFISESSIQNAAKQGNQFLFLKIQIFEGQHRGAVIFDRLNLVNSNPVAVDIANRRLSSICRACGITSAIADSAQLHNIPMSGVVDIEENPGYQPKNVIKSYSAAKPAVTGAISNPQPVQEQPAPAAAPVQTQPQVGASPWTNQQQANDPTATQPPTNTTTPPWA